MAAGFAALVILPPGSPSPRGPHLPITAVHRSAAPSDSDACAVSSNDSSSTQSRSASDEERGHHVEVSWVHGRCSLRLIAEGVFKLTTDFTDVAQIDAGGSVEVSQSDGSVKRRLDMEPGSPRS